MEASAQFKEVDPKLVEISGANPRKDIKGESFKEFKASIAEQGILEPLIVRPKGDKYELVAGERRLTAAKELKLEKVPVVIRELDDHSARVFMLLENLQREDLAPLEEAAAIEELLKPGQTTINGKPFMTQQELAQKLSKSQPWIANRLRLLKAPEKLKEYLTSGQMTPQHLITLLPYCDKEALMGQILRKYDDKRKYGDGCSVEELHDYVGSILQFDDTGKFAFRPDKAGMGYHMKELAKDMDLSSCENCKKTIIFEDEDYDGKKAKVRVCLETDCFRPKVNEARKKVKDREHVKLEKAVKSGAVSTDKLRYGLDYKNMDYVSFPREWCKGCPKMQKGSGTQRTLGGSGHDQICLMPRCLDQRAEYYREQAYIIRKNIKAALQTAEKIYMKDRLAGLKKHELQFIINSLVGGSQAPRKLGGLSEAQLEKVLLEAAIKECSHELGYGDLDRKALEFIDQLPFKLEGDFSIKPPEPPKLEREPKDPALTDAEQGSKKVAKEKRKTKGVKA